MLAKKDELLILPLGGLEQIGANCAMIGNDKDWIIIDLGIAFYDKLGIEVLTPDISFPISVKDHIKGIFVTHAHEDHMGAIPYLWPRLQCPIYLTEFPGAILKRKFDEFPWKDEVKINIVQPRNRFKVGSFEIEFVSLAHSVLGSCGIYIKTKAGTLFHTGDWKIDEAPLLGDESDEERLAQIGKEGVDCLLCDSTNILEDGKDGFETDVREALVRIVSQHKNKRVTVTCFASNIARLETVLHVAKKTGRKATIIGRSMHRMINAVSETSYCSNEFKNNISAIATEEEAASMPPEKVLLICTGSQGETRSALYRLARGENRVIKMGKQDVVLFSSKVIPGNELDIRELQNMLIRKEVEIVTTDTEDDIHVSGHPTKASLAKMYKWLKPKSFIPVHGDARMLYAHKKFAEDNGISETLLAESGDIVKCNDGKLQKIEHRDIIFNAIDGVDLIPLNSKILRERNIMSCNGYVCVSLVLSPNGDILYRPITSVHGIYIDNENYKNLEKLISKILKTEIAKRTSKIDTLKSECEASIKKLFFKNFDKKPIVTVHIHKK
ncbi:MAG: ribonuclease J [Holosporales bacterium]|jgi:ribonuclease J|nr:ribonuclease J [Holosporales bacterium]